MIFSVYSRYTYYINGNHDIKSHDIWNVPSIVDHNYLFCQAFSVYSWYTWYLNRNHDIKSYDIENLPFIVEYNITFFYGLFFLRDYCISLGTQRLHSHPLRPKGMMILSCWGTHGYTNTETSLTPIAPKR